MKSLKGLIQKHALLASIIAVMFPLLIILFLQYRSLVTLEKTLPVFRKQVMKDYLGAVADDVRETYWNASTRVLSVPAAAIAQREGGIIRGTGQQSDLIIAIAGVASYYAQADFPGAKRYFVTVVSEFEGIPRTAVLFYSPANGSMEFDPEAPEWRAIQVASASYALYIRAEAVILPGPVGIVRDPEHPLIVKPVVDGSGKIVALAGMLVDSHYCLDSVLPNAIQRHAQDFFPADYQDLIVAVNDEEGTPLMGSDVNDKTAEARMGFDFIFQRWHLTARLRQMSEAQWARRNFFINLSLWGLMTLFLIGGIVMTLRTAARAIKLSQMKSDFVSNVSHELRTPLASIRLFGEFLKHGRVKDEVKMREYGEYIETESGRLSQLINNILDFSRIESGLRTYHYAPADICDVAGDAIKMFDVRLKQNSFVIAFNPPSAPLPRINIDSDAITQALVNLLDNAVKYSGASKEIDVSLGQENNWVTISVADKGPGIPPEDHERIFERFHRVSTGLVHDVKGSGLGLAIVKHIVDAHGGTVTVDSQPKKGSTFTIRLPLNNSLNGSEPEPSGKVEAAELKKDG